MKEHGVYHDPKATPVYYSYAKKVKPEKLAAEGVILDEATQVYWNWHKSKAKDEAEASEKGYTHTKNAYKGYVGQKIGDDVFVGFKPDKVNKTGYMEIYSQIMMDKGFDPLPTYEPIPEHEAMKDNELVLTTFKVNVQTHSRTQNCKWLSEIFHENPAWLNPETAAKQGVGEGDIVKVRSEVGEVVTKVRVTPAIVPGVVAISFHCGHWEYGRYASSKPSAASELPDPDSARIWWEGRNGVHCNWIIPNKSDPISGQMRWMDTVVSLARVEAA
jgi:anaerobic selenocysteine-containing dehydrogenase